MEYSNDSIKVFPFDIFLLFNKLKPTLSKSSFFIFSFIIIIIFFIHISHGENIGSQEDNSNKNKFNIGAMIDVNSRTGREQKIAMEIAIQDFNNISKTNEELVLYLRDSDGDPFKAASMANDLIEKNKARAVIGMETWQEAAMVAQVGNQAEVPIISFSTPSIKPPLLSVELPFLVQMANNNNSLKMKCLASIVQSYGWRKVIAVYEDDAYGSNSGLVTLLSEALLDVDSEIEHSLVLPPFSILANPKSAIRDELEKLKNKQSRVFIVLQLSLQFATHLATEAKQMGLMAKDSVWITTESITNLLDTFNSSIVSSMQGFVGIKTFYPDTSSSFIDFSVKFREKFRLEYPEEDNLKPGIYALRAYDAISIVAKAMERLKPNNDSTSKMLLQNILSSNFNGLSGDIRFEKAELLTSSLAYLIVNVIGKSYQELGFWSSDFGFSSNGSREGNNGRTMQVLRGSVHWPGNLVIRIPKGWVMPSDARPLRIGIPAKTSFGKFVNVSEGKEPDGFSIELFKQVEQILSHKFDLPYTFEAFRGTYDDLVDQVYHNKFDAVVGDMTILANRSKNVDFTQPYLESGLSMIVPVNPDISRNAWLFLKPFTTRMWLVICGIFVYTLFMVWLLEHKTNLEFGGTRKDQLSTAFWYTFSSIFFAHKENVKHTSTRVVVMVWLLLVYVVISSYQASLTSTLTVQIIEPTVSNIDILIKDNLHVGCDGDSYILTYLKDVLGIKDSNIKRVSSDNYEEEFKSGNISAAFLELPYERMFTTKLCSDYKATEPHYRFGGFGFVFPKGSPLATEFSEAFLILSENGNLTALEKKWFGETIECSNEIGNQSLKIYSFLSLFIMSLATTTIVILIYLIRLLWERKSQLSYHHVNITPTGQLSVPQEASSTTLQIENINDQSWTNSSNADYMMHSSSSESIIEMAKTDIDHLDTKRYKSFTPVSSFPTWNRRVEERKMFSSP